MDLAEVAAQAGVGKTTVYRRWRTPARLVADMLTEMAETSLAHADTGSLREDLIANARLVARTLADPRQGALFKALVAAAICDPGTTAALHRFYDVRITEWEPCIAAAVDRGEVPPETDSRAVISAVSAPLYYRFLISGDPIDDQVAVTAAEAAAAAAGAGLYVRQPLDSQAR